MKSRKRKAARKPKPVRVKRSVKQAAKSARTRHAPAAPKTSDPIDALVAVSAQALGLPLDPAWLGGIKFNLGLSLRLAAMFDKFPLPDDIEPGPVFHA
jgi:hypothetical protein